MRLFATIVLCPVMAFCAGKSPTMAGEYDVAVIGGGAAKSGCRAHEVDLARLKRRLSASGAVVPGSNGFDKGEGAVAR